MYWASPGSCHLYKWTLSLGLMSGETHFLESVSMEIRQLELYLPANQREDTWHSFAGRLFPATQATVPLHLPWPTAAGDRVKGQLATWTTAGHQFCSFTLPKLLAVYTKGIACLEFEAQGIVKWRCSSQRHSFHQWSVGKVTAPK